jgi:hypothetical protein
MKSIRITGLCLATTLVMSVVAVGSASAAPVWESCVKGGTGGTHTKYTKETCEESSSSSSGEFGFGEVKGTEKAINLGTLSLADTNVPIEGTVEVTCTGEGKGSVGPGKFSRITEIPESTIKCTAGEHCEKIEGVAKPLNLPWQGELEETENEIRNYITNGKTGKEAPGWDVVCRVLGIKEEDKCTNEKGFTNSIDNLFSLSRFEWLVLLDFTTKSPNATCSVGGASSGRVRGTIILLIRPGGVWALGAPRV